MKVLPDVQELQRKLAEAEARIQALLLSGGQTALRESEERYRQIVESTTEGIVKVDAAAMIVFSNQRFGEMLGYELDELAGKSLFSFMDEESRAIAHEARERRQKGIRDSIEVTFVHKEGRGVVVSLTGAPVFDGQGRYAGALALARDVTQQKKMMAQLMISDRMASVGTLAAGVAHEINNPMAVVISNLAFVADCLKSGTHPDLQEPIEEAREAARRVKMIVRDLKLFSRSPEQEQLGPVDIRVAIESSVRMAWNEIRHRGRFVAEYGDVPRVLADEGRLGQVLLNLIVNAAHALPEDRIDGNEIRITTRRAGDRVLIEVRDTGKGIPPENLRRIFDAFFTTKPVGVGTGLGLAISHRIVTSLGGELFVESKVGKGTTFTISLRVASDAPKPVDATPPVPATALAPASVLRGRILVVDDEEMVLRSIRRNLAPDQDIVTASSGSAALDLLRAGEKFDVILCDLMMPNMSGMDLHRELELAVPDQAKRMIFVTGGAFTPMTQQFLVEQKGRHIDKPFSPAHLRGVLQKLLADPTARVS